MNLRMDRIAYPVTALGPGRRVVVWVAGCSRRCPGCITPHLLPRESGREVPVEVLTERLAELPMPLDGITLSGGDPADQPMAVAALLRAVRATQPRWNVMLYTGEVIERMRGDAEQAALLKEIDLLIDGPYRREVPQVHRLAGSGNQRLWPLTPAGREMLAALEAPGPAFNLGVGAPDGDFLIGVSDAASRAAAHTLLQPTPPVCDAM